jgi:hypothetical protein
LRALALIPRLVDRVFWLRDTINGILAWDKKKNNKPNKSSTIVDVEPSPAVRSAKEWFEFIDEDGSGELDQDELATLYQKARGEKLKGKQVSMPTVPVFTHVSVTIARAAQLYSAPQAFSLTRARLVECDSPASTYQH